MALTKASYSMITGACVNVLDYGAKGDNVTDDTLAIQAAINAAIALGQGYGRFNLKPAPLENFAVVTRPSVFFPKGTYRISNRLEFNNTLIFKGENSIIYQTDATKDIFWTEGPYINEFEKLIFVGGNRQIFVQNGPTGQTGIEGAFVKITDCEFQASESYAVRTQDSGGGGGFFTDIQKCRFFGGKLFGYFRHDQCSIADCWIGTYSEQPADTALFYCAAATVFKNNVLVPGLDYAQPGDTRRYIDSYSGIFIHNNRFGAEGGGGMPIVYSFHDQSLSDVYPYQGAIISITDNHIVADGSASRLDKAFIVLKRGLPQGITIENNAYSFDGPYIRTNKMSGSYANLSTYLSTAFVGSVGKENSKRFTFRIKHNSKWAASITQSATDTALLEPYLEYDNGSSEFTVSSFYDIQSKTVRPIFLQGTQFGQTSITTGVSIIDTGITKDTQYWGFGNYSAIYDVYITGNPNAGGSSLYRSPLIGSIVIGVGFSGGQVFEIFYTDIFKPNFTATAEFTVSAVFWDGSSETAFVPTNSTAEIRIKVGNYATGFEGVSENVRLVRRL